MARKIRILVLLFVLATVAHQAWWQGRDLAWDDNLYVAVYPVNADGSPAVDHYLAALDPVDFEPISAYFSEQANHYELALYEPLAIRLGPPVQGLPPSLPRERSRWQTMLWSLQFRYWAWQHSPGMPVKPHIRLYLLYHDPASAPALAHSTAMQKGRVGLVNLYGDTHYQAQNAVIIAHELLHTLGATDKYDFSTNLPLYPAGFAEPDRAPLYPQSHAELMAGRMPVSADKAVIPERLAETLVGPLTAREIGWVRQP